eukprot:TRINITY_DN63728_c0_g1_i1.p1 TRINITY_DN63728_c0_g1~~TRINITY_DN63728_c0_g1_i1.p1  ORF type:complete len:917 (-),score=135.79 TRINITY_DN63728_c0_g1_i1:164-2857(-)
MASFEVPSIVEGKGVIRNARRRVVNQFSAASPTHKSICFHPVDACATWDMFMPPTVFKKPCEITRFLDVNCHENHLNSNGLIGSACEDRSFLSHMKVVVNGCWSEPNRLRGKGLCRSEKDDQCETASREPDIRGNSFNSSHGAVSSTDSSFDCRPSSMSALWAASCGLAFGLELASTQGLVHELPLPLALLSMVLASGGAGTCVWAAKEERASSADTVVLNPLTLVMLAGFCGMIAPLPLVQPEHILGANGIGTSALLALPGLVGSIAIFEVTHRNFAQINVSKVQQLQREFPTTGLQSSAMSFSERILKHWSRHFIPDGLPGATDRGIGSMYFGATLIATVCSANLALGMTSWRKSFFNLLEARDSAGVYAQIYQFAPIAVASTLVSIYMAYLTNMWELRWREELTRDFLGVWLQRTSRYCIGRRPEEATLLAGGSTHDNFDQRIAEDTAQFASNSRGLLCAFTESIIRLGIFGPALISLSPTARVWQSCLALTLVSSFLTHAIGKSLTLRGAALQRAEGDLRSSLVRIRIFADEIALQRGEDAESASVAECIEVVKAATWLLARASMNLSCFTSAYGTVGGMVPFLILVPHYLHGDISLGLMFQMESLMSAVQHGLNFFIGSYADIAEWQVGAQRLLSLETMVESVSAQTALDTNSDDGNIEGFLEQDEGNENLEVQGLTIRSIGGDVLLDSVRLEFHRGDRVELSGPARCGTSSLLRVLAGSFPGNSTASRVHTSSLNVLLLRDSGFLIPQRETLRMCLAYPEAAPPCDDALCEALRSCGLSRLCDQLDVSADWGRELPLEDRQRLAFSRLIAKWPRGVRWLFLDKAASALDETESRALHELLAANTPASAGLVVVPSSGFQSHASGWRRFSVNPVMKTIVEFSTSDVGTVASF